MRAPFGCALLLAGAIAAAASPAAGDVWLIVPGEGIGAVRRDTSEARLRSIYGAAQVRRGEAPADQGGAIPVTEIYPDIPQQKLVVQWQDPATRLKPAQVAVSHQENSRWHLANGISIGTPLTSVAQLNGGPIALSGFDWSYSGTVLDCLGGKLQYLCKPQQLIMRLEPKPGQDARQAADYERVLNDQVIRSDFGPMRRLNPSVYELIVVF